MREPEAPKAGWIHGFPASPPDKKALARIVDADGGRDDAENSYYEEAADPGPTFIKLVRTAWSFDEREGIAEVGW